MNPRQVSYAGALRALPVGTVLLDRSGDVWQKVDDTDREDGEGYRLQYAWASPHWITDRTDEEMFEGVGRASGVGPLQVLYTPEKS